jgi:DNA polymerase-3 subunit alpha
MSKRIILFDLETTGLPKQPCYDKYHSYKKLQYYNSSRIVQIGMQIYQYDEKSNHTLIAEYDYIIKPDMFEINNSHIHKITQEIAISKGIDFIQAIKNIKHEFKTASLIVAHNALFDTNIILSEMFRYGLISYIDEFAKIPVFCTSRQTTNLLKLRYNKTQYKQPKLIELYRWLFKSNAPNNLHNALQDTKVLSKCFFELLDKKYFSLY